MPEPNRYEINRYEYKQSFSAVAEGYSFYALIAAAVRLADSGNLDRLKALWPGVVSSLHKWYDTPGAL